LQTTSDRANDCFAEVQANPNSEIALEQSLHVWLHVLFHGTEHIESSEHRLEGRTF
jgi:hypothetical protein